MSSEKQEQPIEVGHVTSAPEKEDQESSNNPENPEHPKVLRELDATYDKTQAQQAPEGTIQSGVFEEQGHGAGK